MLGCWHPNFSIFLTVFTIGHDFGGPSEFREWGLNPPNPLRYATASNVNLSPKRRQISNRQHDVANPEDGNRHRVSDIKKQAWNWVDDTEIWHFMTFCCSLEFVSMRDKKKKKLGIFKFPQRPATALLFWVQVCQKVTSLITVAQKYFTV